MSLNWPRSIVRYALVGLVGFSFAIGWPGLTPIVTAQSNGDPVRPLLRSGSRGSEVEELQGILTLLGFYSGPIDGVYSESVLIAVTQFQQVAGLQQDGVVGASTWAKLLPTPPNLSQPSLPSSPSKPAPQPASQPATSQPAVSQPAVTNAFPVLRKGSTGDEVLKLQERLQAIGLLQGQADGIFGEATEAAVKAAQQQYKLEVDGVVGEATWQALMRRR